MFKLFGRNILECENIKRDISIKAVGGPQHLTT